MALCQPSVAWLRAVLLVASLAGPARLGADLVRLNLTGPRLTPVEQVYRKGVDLLQAGRLGDAEAAFTQSTKIDSSSGIGYIGLAEIAIRRDQPQQAEELIRTALRTAPKHAGIHAAWGMFLQQRQRWPEAEAAFRKALMLDAKSIESKAGLAKVLLRGLNRPAEAAAEYKDVVRADPSDGAAYFGLGVALIRLNKREEALPAFENAARLEPKNPVPQQALGELYLAQNNTVAALKAFDAAVAANPKFFEAHVSRGDIFMNRGDRALALSEYEAASAAMPQAPVPKVKAGMAYQAMGKNKEAQERYLAALALNPNQPPVLNNLAWMAAQSKTDLDRALQWANKAAALTPNDPTVLDTLGWVHCARGEFAMALRTLQKAVRMNPKDPGTHYHLGVAYEQTGQKVEAEAALRQALQLSQSFDGVSDAHQRLARYSRR